MDSNNIFIEKNASVLCFFQHNIDDREHLYCIMEIFLRQGLVV